MTVRVDREEKRKKKKGMMTRNCRSQSNAAIVDQIRTGRTQRANLPKIRAECYFQS